MPLKAHNFEVYLGHDRKVVGESHKAGGEGRYMVLLEGDDLRDKKIGHRRNDLANLPVRRSRLVRHDHLVRHNPLFLHNRLDHQSPCPHEVVWAPRRWQPLQGDCARTLISEP